LKVHDCGMGTSASSGGSASGVIFGTALSWPGVHEAWGGRGERSLRVGRREIGHLHGDRVAHFGFPKAVGARLRAEGRVTPHPVAPDNPGMGARAIAIDADIADVIALLRENYERVVARHGVPEGADADASAA
jgi:Family of unknown function (DUF5519)